MQEKHGFETIQQSFYAYQLHGQKVRKTIVPAKEARSI